jgi:hypothetical protein
MAAKVLIAGTWVGLLFPTSGVRHSTTRRVDSPSGDYEASVTVTCPRSHQAEWTQKNAPFELYAPNGGRIWGGLVSEVERGDTGVTIHAKGIGEELVKWKAVYDADPGGGVDLQPSFVPNDAVDYAESIGAPFGRYGVDLGSTPISTSENEPLTNIGTLLQRAAIMQGKRVHVDSQGAITFVADPTTPEWMTTPNPLYMGTADDQYVSRLYGYYLSEGAAAFDVRLTGSPTGGTFTLSGNGATTGVIAFNATAATVQTAVQALGGVFASAVVKIPSGSTARWVISLTAGNATLTGNGAALTGGTTPGVSVDQTRGDGLVYAEDDDAVAVFGHMQRDIDLRSLGSISASTAQAYIDGRYALVGGRMGWTEGVELTPRNLLHVSGARANPRHVKAGTMLEIPDNRDARSSPTVRAAIRIVLSEVEVTEGRSPSAVAAPLGFSPRDIEGALSAPENPAATEEA